MKIIFVDSVLNIPLGMSSKLTRLPNANDIIKLPFKQVLNGFLFRKWTYYRVLDICHDYETDKLTIYLSSGTNKSWN